MNTCWLPETVPCSNWANFPEYDELLYQIFKAQFIDSAPIFNGFPVKIRFHPKVCDKEQTFFHVTSKNYTPDTERCPDPRRCERINWIRAFIENYDCDPSLCEACEGVKVWYEPYHSYQRVYLLLEEERYVVILEKRESFILLITAYYVDQDHSLRKLLKKYAQYKIE